MTLARMYRPSTRIQHDDLDGLLNVLDRTISEKGEDGELDTLYYIGAFDALSIVRHHEFVDTQEDFMRLLERLKEERESEE